MLTTMTFTTEELVTLEKAMDLLRKESVKKKNALKFAFDAKELRETYELHDKIYTAHLNSLREELS